MNKLKLLVVEHNQSISGKISQIPGIKDYLLLYASSQEETLTYLKSDAEIVIMVIENTLAGSDFRLLPLIKTINPFLRMIIVTDDWNLTEIRKAMNNGVIDVLVQPLEANDLKEALKLATNQVVVRISADKNHRKLLALQREVHAAGSLQQHILPESPAVFNGINISGSMIPAKNIGGDFYDFFMIDKQRLGLVVGDVCGKGIPAALFMAVSRSLIKTIALKGGSPCECISEVNQVLSRDNPSAMFATVFYAVINMERKTITYCNAGHDMPYLIKNSTRLMPLERTKNMAIGFDAEIDYQSKLTRYETGDMLFMYTDGIPEATNADNQFYGRNRLEKILKLNRTGSPESLLDRTLDSVQLFISGRAQSDDITAVAVKF